MQKLINWIKELFQNITNFIRGKATIAVDIVNALKSTVDNGTFDFFANLTKTTKDNEILEKVRLIIGEVALRMKITKEIIGDSKTPNQIVQEVIELLRKENKNVQADFYILLAGELTKALADGKIDLGEAIAISQMIYKKYLNK